MYAKVWSKFCQFAISINHVYLPASVPLVALYIAHLVSTPPIPKPSSLATSLSAISYYQKIAGSPDPTAHFLIRKLLQGVSKSNPSSDLRIPITIPILHKLISSAYHISNSPYEAALLTSMYTLMFHAFLRVGEVTSSPHNIQFSQVNIQKDITLVFHSFKHHQGPPFSLTIPPTHPSSFCPVRALGNYIISRGRSPGPLFCYPDGAPITTSRFRALLAMSLSFNSLQSHHITPHSFRIGAATYAASRGYSSTQIQSMGRWHSSASDRYVRISSFTINPSVAPPNTTGVP